MGILNVTPDSFSDGGLWTDRDVALRHAFEMVDQGADIIDIGAESTRPGCQSVTSGEEMERLEPVLRDLLPSIDVPVSVDTMKPEVAGMCISMGVDMINDVNGLRASGMAEVCAGADVDVVISHMYGPYDTLHSVTMGDGYREEIAAFLDAQCGMARDAGIQDDRIIVDPGVGFGKTADQNLEIVRDLSFLGHDHRILVGLSRKRFIRNFYPDMDADDASAFLSKTAADAGADIVRVHNVARTIASLRPL
jgi:dihydropteroate synthase